MKTFPDTTGTSFHQLSLFAILTLLACWPLGKIIGQSCQDVSVQLSAEVQAVPPRIMLNWVPNDSATLHYVYRKLRNAITWGAPLATLSGSASEFIDSNLTVGIPFEYRVTRAANAFTGYGYIYSGIEIPPIEFRGRILLLVDDTFADSLEFEIRRLQADFEGDGWKVLRMDIDRSLPVTDVKSMIIAAYNNDPGNTRALFLLGHIPVPYSGEINVDGHGDHTGAYPADVYYADVNGVWTDQFVNNVSAGDPRNHNVPGDGKFDQATIPTDVELQVGRVDFFNMPSFALNEQELLRQYLDKDHAYRHKHFTATHRALVDDNFGYFGGEAFAASGYKNLAPLVGNDNVVAADYFTTMADSSYLWSYGCGGGWYQGAGGVGTTGEFANSSLESVFTMLFGSYFGDWDTPDNFLRAPLAQGKTLTNVWSGRPHWQFHHMGLGENIGYDVRLSQNNVGLYFSNFGGRVVHTAFLGDPTLRNDVLAPVSSVTVSKPGYNAHISWIPSGQEVNGYHVYVRSPSSEDYVRINDEMVNGYDFSYPCLSEYGTYRFMVRSMNLQQSPSGSYYNLSQGQYFDYENLDIPEINADASFSANNDIVTFTNASIGATSYLWIFGDGETSTEENPVHDYIDGDFDVTLIAANECVSDTFYLTVSILTSVDEHNPENNFSLSPNPTKGKFKIQFRDTRDLVSVKIYNLSGKLLDEHSYVSVDEEINISSYPSGIYIVRIESKGAQQTLRVVKE